MKRAVLKKISIAALLATMLGTAAMAQDDGGWWPRMGRGMGQGYGGGPMMGLDSEAMLDRIDGRLAFMKTELKITDDQKEAWDELAEAVRSTAETHNDMMRSMHESFRDGSFTDMPLPDRLTLQETHLGARLEQIKTVKAAVDKLYALLDDDQKKAADEIVLPTIGMGMGGMGMGGRGGFGPGMMR